MRGTTSKRALAPSQLIAEFILVGVAVSAFVATPASSAKPIGATVIDRFGNRHDLSGITIKDRTELQYYVGTQRRTVGFDHIDKLIVDGESGDEERPVKIHLRTGRVDAGRLFTGGHGASTNQDISDGSTGGGARAPTGVRGKTSLGPWMLSLNDVREVRFHHPAGGPVPGELPVLKASVVTTHGDLFEVTDLLMSEKQTLRYMRNRRKMTLKLDKVDKIQFAEYSTGQEQRPVTITLWSGKMLHGSVDATVARYSGETDRQYARRIGAAVTGQLAAGFFSAGMHDIKLIRFHPGVEEDTADTKSVEATQPAAP